VLPTVNAATQIIDTPGEDPPPVPATEVVVVEPPAPPAPVITDDLVPIDPPATCPAPWMMIALRGEISLPAGELKPGMFVKTYHEQTMDFGTYQITHVQSVQDAERIQIEFDHVDFVCSLDHKFYMNGEWVTASELNVGDKVGLAPNEHEVLSISEYESGEVIRITVNEAHTYVCEGILSHNKTPAPEFDPPIVFEYDPWWSIIPRNLFGFGGSFDGNSWFPYVPVAPVEVPQVTIETANPSLLPPVFTGGGGKPQLDFGLYDYDRD
jgi:hypothetical protein